MESMGTILRQAREAKKLSLEDVSKNTKISAHVLSALETDEISKLPSGIYARAFVRTYSGFLGIGNAALDELERMQKPVVIPTVAAVKPETPMTEWVGKDRNPVKINKRLIGIVVGVVVGLVLAGLFWGGVFRGPVQDVGTVLSPVTVAKTAVATKAQVVPVVLPVSAPAAAVAAPVAAESSRVAAAVDGLTLEVLALDRVWVRVKADNLLLFEGTLAKNDHEEWTAKREFLLRVGSASSVRLTLNDKPLTKIGNKGEVKTFVINKEGIIKTR